MHWTYNNGAEKWEIWNQVWEYVSKSWKKVSTTVQVCVNELVLLCIDCAEYRIKAVSSILHHDTYKYAQGN